MKRPLTIVVVGIALALVGFCAIYFGASAPRLAENSNAPELAWLQKEFNLNNADFKRVSELHESYLPQCAEMCRRIAVANDELRTLLSQTNLVTADIEKKIDEASQLRAECHKQMLKHFFAVSQAMPPEQGKRYLTWVQEHTLLSDAGMMAESHTGHEGHGGHE